MDSTRSKSTRWLKLSAMVAGGGVLLYVLVYVLLSASGKYEPYSLVSIRSENLVYAWAPRGFYDASHPWSSLAGGWHRKVIFAFYPLWLLDIRYVHEYKIM